jgi:hypothetical protein
MDRGDGFRFVAAAVELRHAHAAEADGGHLQRTELTLLHWEISEVEGEHGRRLTRRVSHELALPHSVSSLAARQTAASASRRMRPTATRAMLGQWCFG